MSVPSFKGYMKSQFHPDNLAYTLLLMTFMYITAGLIFVPLILGLTVTFALGFQTAIPYVNDSLGAIVRTYSIIFFFYWISYNYRNYKKELYKVELTSIDLSEIHRLGSSDSVQDQQKACELIASLGLFSPQFMGILDKLEESENYKVREASAKARQTVNERYTIAKRNSDKDIGIVIKVSEKLTISNNQGSTDLNIKIINSSSVSDMQFAINVLHEGKNIVEFTDENPRHLDPKEHFTINRVLPLQSLPITVESRYLSQDGVEIKEGNLTSVQIIEQITLNSPLKSFEYQSIPNSGTSILDAELDGETLETVGGHLNVRMTDTSARTLEIKYTLQSETAKKSVDDLVTRRVLAKYDHSLSDVKIVDFTPEIFVKPFVYFSKKDDQLLLNVEVLNTSDLPIKVSELKVIADDVLLELREPQLLYGQQDLTLSTEFSGSTDFSFETVFDYSVFWESFASSLVFIDL